MAKKAYIPSHLIESRIMEKFENKPYVIGVFTTISRSELIEMFSDYSSLYVNQSSYVNSLISACKRNENFLFENDELILKKEMTLRIGQEISVQLEDIDLSEELSNQFNDHDFSEEISDALSNHDFSDEISDALSNHDFSEEISDALSNHDFSDEISDAKYNYDFSEEISKALENYDFSEEISKALENYDFSELFPQYYIKELISDALSNHDFTSVLKNSDFVSDVITTLIHSESFFKEEIQKASSKAKGDPLSTRKEDMNLKTFCSVFSHLYDQFSENWTTHHNEGMSMSIEHDDKNILISFNIVGTCVQMKFWDLTWFFYWEEKSANWMTQVDQFMRMCEIHHEVLLKLDV